MQGNTYKLRVIYVCVLTLLVTATGVLVPFPELTVFTL
jgi:hypothetical protein